MGSEATGIRQTWREGGLAGSRQRKVMTGNRAAASETGDAQASGGTCGEITRDWYDESDTRDAQVGG